MTCLVYKNTFQLYLYITRSSLYVMIVIYHLVNSVSFQLIIIEKEYLLRELCACVCVCEKEREGEGKRKKEGCSLSFLQITQLGIMFHKQ